MTQRLLTAYVDVPPTPPKLRQLPISTPLSPMDENRLQSVEAAKKKRNSNPGNRIISGKVYDPVHGTTCHQCRQKTLSDGIRCTLLKKGKRCTLLMCKRCLSVRYGEDIDSIFASGRGTQAIGHDSSTDYVWSCPKCRGICNCSMCRKSKNLPPTGILAYLSKAAGVASANELLEEPRMLEAVKSTYRERSIPRSKPNAIPKAKTAHAAPKAVPKVSLPKPDFARIPGTDGLTINALSPRIHLREFIYRFNGVLGIAKKHVMTTDNLLWDWDEYVAEIFLAKILKVCASSPDSDQRSELLSEARKALRHEPAEAWDKCEEMLIMFGYEIPKDSKEQNHLHILVGLCDIALYTPSIRENIDNATELTTHIRKDALASVRESQDAWNKRKAVLQSERMTIALKDQVDEWKERYTLAETQHLDDIKGQYAERDWNIRKLSLRGDCCIGNDGQGNTYYWFSDVGEGKSEGDRWGRWIVCESSEEAVDKAYDDGQDHTVSKGHKSTLFFFDTPDKIKHLSIWISQEAGAEAAGADRDVTDLLSALSRCESWLHLKQPNQTVLEDTQMHQTAIADEEEEEEEEEKIPQSFKEICGEYKNKTTSS